MGAARRSSRRAPLIAVAFAGALLLHGAPSQAQCSTTSTCRSCHEAHDPPTLDRESPWHRDHRFGGLCQPCHGGNSELSDIAGAHLGLRAPLADPAASCVDCHQAETPALLARYQAEKATRAAAPPPPATPPASPPPAARAGPRWKNAFLALLFLALGGGGLAWIRADRRRGLLPAPADASLGGLRAVVSRPSWSPYLAGALLGLVAAAALALTGHPLGPSGGVQGLAAALARPFTPGQVYWQQIAPGTPGFQAWLLAGVFLGSLVSAALSGELRLRWLPDEGWTSTWGPGRWKRWLIAYLGAALIQLAAGIAGGCTGGLAISGGALLAPGAFVFMAGMFAAGIPTAYLVHRFGREGRPS